MMLSIIYAIISGISMTLQGVFNTRLEEKVGTWETNVIVQGTALVLTLIILILFGKGDFKAVKDVNKLYLLGGILGVIIIFTVMKSIGSMGATLGIGIILIAPVSYTHLDVYKRQEYRFIYNSKGICCQISY